MVIGEYLSEFGEDLVRKASKGKLDDAICRDYEINRIIEILARRKKNNVLLIGEPGVGKTSIVEGIAKKISLGDTNKILDKKIIFSLDYHYLVSGTMYRGQLEERATNLIKEIRKNKHIILFIDEIHSIFSNKTGSSSSSDLNNFLKPYLSSGEVQIIGITTYDEYRTSIGKDKALARRFQNVKIGQTSKDQTYKILKNNYKIYEKYHNVKYDEDVLKECVKLAQRYIFDRQMPDSAIDILDEAGSIVSLYNTKSIPFSRKITNLKNKLKKLENEKTRRIKNEEYDDILKLKKELDLVKDSIEIEKDKWYKSNLDKVPIVKIEDIYKTVSRMTGISEDHFTNSYLDRIDNMNKLIKTNIFCQDDAVDKISKILKRKVVDINNDKPLASYLLSGPSGVGKSSFAKLISEAMFGSDKNLIRLDMSEYADSTSINKIIGSSPGYVGYGEGGILTEEVRKYPHSVILFDEVEKADKEIFNLLLQILDEGHLKDSSGNLVNFKHTIIILTSNLGINVPETVGFVKNEKDYQDSIYKEVKKFFRTEFLNRLDDIICFNHLDEKGIEKIYNLELKKIKTKLEKINISIKVYNSMKKHIIKHGYDFHYGARFMHRTMYNFLIDNILEKYSSNVKLSIEYDKEVIIKIIE